MPPKRTHITFSSFKEKELVKRNFNARYPTSGPPGGWTESARSDAVSRRWRYEMTRADRAHYGEAGWYPREQWRPAICQTCKANGYSCNFDLGGDMCYACRTTFCQNPDQYPQNRECHLLCMQCRRLPGTQVNPYCQHDSDAIRGKMCHRCDERNRNTSGEPRRCNFQLGENACSRCINAFSQRQTNQPKCIEFCDNHLQNPRDQANPARSCKMCKKHPLNKHFEAEKLSKERRAELQLRAKELMLRMGLGINWPSGDPRRADLRSEQGWHGVEILGQGTYGIAALYVRMSQRDRIIDTVVIKENWLASPWQVEFNPSFVWKGPSMWHRPGPPDPDQPLEAHVQELLDNRQKAHGHECFVGMRTWSVYPAIKAYRLYLEYCRHYDLGTLCEDNAERSRTQYKMLDRKDREQALHGAIFEEQKFEARYFAQVPEAFCWFVLQHLATACVQMVNLNTDHSGDEDPNDTKPRVQVIHGDMKTENVFLGESDQTGTWHPSYKIPKLGDFGLSTITDRGDNLNPRLLKLKGTPGWIPPEVMLDDNNKILAETNVFGAALIVLALATNQYHRGHLQPEEDVLVNINAMMRAQTLITFNNQNPDESNNQTPDQANNQTPDQAFQEALVSYLKWIDFRIWRYSPALRSLLRQCLDIDPSRRPSPRQLRDRIDNIIAANNYAQESHAHPLENYKTRQWRERGRYRPDPGYARPAMRL